MDDQENIKRLMEESMRDEDWDSIHKEMREGSKPLEQLSDAELQEQAYARHLKDKSRSKDQVWQRRSHKRHLENLHNLHEQAGKHGNPKKTS